MPTEAKRTLRVNYSKELGKWRVEGRTAGFGQFNNKSAAKNKADQVWEDKTDTYTRLIIEKRNGSQQTVKTRSGVSDSEHDLSLGQKAARLGTTKTSSKKESTSDGNGLFSKAGDILSGIGKGGASVMEEMESGGGIDPLGLEDNDSSQEKESLDEQFGVGMSGNAEGSLDMDLEDFD